MSTVDHELISVRFKHGIHTIYLFVEASAPMSDVSAELVNVLRDRYPGGLPTSIAPAKTTPLPSEPVLAYGLLNVPNDPSRGWKRIKTGDGEVNSPTKCGIKNNSIVAFTFVADHVDDEVLFEVEWPKDDDELYEQVGA
ncbi:hypothetical protein EsDP_00005647 [Epichloe bromicola]|uniref:Uncharacterized protein n=1 Tax=Epichloe bromicola TaxID=79588 RepID=A0ABQ0CVA5_9HYPO